MNNILDLTRKGIEDWITAQGLKKYAVTQILQWLYQKRAHSFETMTNVSQETRRLLANNFTIDSLEIAARHRSSVDGSTKYLFRLRDGRGVEGVLMPIKKRTTLCISTQVGCAMGCLFCRTAEMKLVRNLTQGEILGQIMAVQDDLLSRLGGTRGEKFSEVTGPNLDQGPLPRITNVVMMGMGEPFHNYDNVIGALQIMTDDFGLGISQRKITVSTVGLAPEIEQFGRESKVKLALSLNATTDEGRGRLMPVAKKYSLERLTQACRNYAAASKHKVTFEYVMMAGVNDSLEDARRIARIGSRVPCKINLIPFNEYPGSPFRRPDEAAVRRFFEFLADRHFQVNIRISKGLDVLAACGQLAVC